MRTTGKRMLSILLCLCMAACMLPTVAFAADTGKAIQLGTDALSKEEAVTVERVQAMIDALPGAEEITEDNTEEVKAQLDAIDEAKAQLSDEELDQLDFSLYTEAASALGGLAKPMLTDSTKKISVRMNAKNGKFTDSVSDGVSTAYGTTHTLTVTPQTGRYVIAGYFAGTDYYKTNPAKYQYSNMTLDKISEADPQTGAVQYQFTATEVIPISNDPNYDYICLYFHCAKLPTLLWTFGNISGEATAPSTDGNTAAIPYVSQKELCGDPNEYTGYYSLADKKDRPYLDWQVISITDKEGNTAGGTVAFDNNHLTYTPTADEAGKTVTITIRPKLGYVEEANTPLSFEIEVKKPVVEQSEFYVTMVIDGYGNAVARPNSAKEGEEIQLTAIPDRGHHFKEWQATSGTSGKIMITNDKFTMPAGNVTVKAIFEANTYTVKLDANGGTIASGQDVTSYTYGTGAALPTADDMTYTGHTFKGWYDNEGLTGDPVMTIGDTETGNKAYWAKWEANAYTVTLNTNGGTINSGNVTEYTYGTGATLPTADDMTYTGHIFKGWYTNKGLTGTPVTAIGDTETGNKEYWAKWEATPNYLDLSGYPDFDNEETVTVNGRTYPIGTDGGRYVNLPETGDILQRFTYRSGTYSAAHENYPTGMAAYRILRQEGGAKLEPIDGLKDLLIYSGCSIRISGKQGIRMITGITQDNKKALTGKGLAGYTLEEYGTVVSWTDALGNGSFLRLGEDYARFNYAYRKGKADPVFARKNGIIQYTNVLVLENLTEADYDKDLTLRAYIQLRNTETGETVTLYGGTVTRSIYYVAQQNADTYKPGTAGYKFVHKIIDAVENRT